MKQLESATLLDVFAIVVLNVILGLSGGPPGVLAGVFLTAVWFVMPAGFVVAFGQFALVAVVLPTGSAVSLFIGEIILIGILLRTLVGLAKFRVRLVAAVNGIMLFGGVVWLLDFKSGLLHVSIIALIGSVSFACYLLHRYERVVVGAVERRGETDT